MPLRLVDLQAPPSRLPQQSRVPAEPKPPAASGKPQRQTLIQRIEQITPTSEPAEIQRCYEGIAQTSDPDAALQATKLLAKRAGFGLPHVKKRVGDALRQMMAKSDSAQKTKGAVTPDEDGVLLFDWDGSAPDFQQQLKFTQAAVHSLCARPGGAKHAFPAVTERLGSMVRIAVQEDGSLSVGELSAAQATALIHTRVQTRRITDAGFSPRQPQSDTVVRTFLGTLSGRLEPTPDMAHTPIYLRDGRLLAENGWDREARVLVHLDCGLEGVAPSPKPSAGEVQDALGFILEDVYGDFPFRDLQPDGTETPDASRANALAMICTPLMRRLFPGPSPVFWVTKPTPGTGGTILGELPSRLMLGKPAMGFPYTANEEEMRKTIVAEARAATDHLFFDDVADFNSRVLIQSITSTMIGGRVLGLSESFKAPNNFNWVGTGNNTYFGDEMARRICTIRLNARTSDIHSRNFRHSDFRGWVDENRGAIIRALLTLIQSWIVAGRPDWTERKLTSFEPWGAAVGGVLAHAGVEGFLGNRRAPGVDRRHTDARKFVQAWFVKWSGAAKTERELFDFARDTDADLLEGGSEADQRRRLYRRLPELEGVIFSFPHQDQEVSRMLASAINRDGDLVYSLQAVEAGR